MDLEQTLITVIVGLVLTTVAGIIAYLSKFRDRKDSVEKKASDKGVIERGMAKELKEEREETAASVKAERIAAVNQLFDTFRSDLELTIQKIYGEMKARQVQLDQLRKEFDELKEKREKS